MKVSTYVRVQTTVYLDRIEEFVTENEKGHPFYVSKIHYGGGSTVALSGPAKVKTPDPETGDRGFIDRSVSVLLDDLRPKYRDAIIESRVQNIRGLTPTTD